MRVLFLLLIAVTMVVSCGENKENNEPETQPATENLDSLNNIPLYPYPQYIDEQIAYVDSMPLAITMQVYENGKMVDSNFIDHEKFESLAKAFAEPDLNIKELRPQYEEKYYQDLTIGSVTFSITAKNPALPVQQVDILLDPLTKKVKNIIIRKQEKTDDGNRISNMLWVNNMNFQVSSSLTKPDGSKTDKVTKVIWDRPLQ